MAFDWYNWYVQKLWLHFVVVYVCVCLLIVLWGSGQRKSWMYTESLNEQWGNLLLTEASWMVVTRPLVQTLKGATHTSSGSSGSATNIGARGNASGGRNITCPTCNKCYSSQHTLRRHIRLECGKEPQFHCPYCPRKTKQRYNLMLHIARAHKPEHHLQNPPQPPTSHWWHAISA